MGRSDRREIESRLVVLMMHLLKWQYQPSVQIEQLVRDDRRAAAGRSKTFLRQLA